jgi:hypothetical protein
MTSTTFTELHEAGIIPDLGFAAIPLQLSPYKVGQEAIDYLNALEHRSYASTFLSDDKSLTRIASTLRGVPEKHASLAGHPDEEVAAAFFWSRHRWSLDRHDLYDITLRALGVADNRGVLWTPLLDAIACSISLNLLAKEGVQTSVEMQAGRVLQWLQAHDSSEAAEQLGQFSSCLMLRCVARSSHLTPGLVHDIISEASLLGSMPERLLLRDLATNAMIPTDGRGVVTSHLVDGITMRRQRRDSHLPRVLHFLESLAIALTRGFVVTPRQAFSLIRRYSTLGKCMDADQLAALRELSVLAVRSIGGRVSPKTLKRLLASTDADCRYLGLELLSELPVQ